MPGLLHEVGEEEMLKKLTKWFDDCVVDSATLSQPATAAPDNVSACVEERAVRRATRNSGRIRLTAGVLAH